MGTTLTALAWLGATRAGGRRCTSATPAPTCCATASSPRSPTTTPTSRRLIDAGRITAGGGARAPAAQPAHARRSTASTRRSPTSPSARPAPATATCCAATACPASSPTSASRELLAHRRPHRAVTALVDMALEAGAPGQRHVRRRRRRRGRRGAGDTEAPVVVGAAGEPRNRARLPGFAFPADAQIDPRSHPRGQGVDQRRRATAPVSVAALADVYAEEQPSARRAAGRSGWVAVAVAVVLVAVVGPRRHLRVGPRRSATSATTAATSPSTAALPGDLGPIPLHSVEQVTTLTVDSLPDFEAAQVEATIAADSLAGAQQVVQRLTERAAQCTAVPTTPGCPRRPHRPATASPTASPPRAAPRAPRPRVSAATAAPAVPRYRQPTRRSTEAALFVLAFVVGACGVRPGRPRGPRQARPTTPLLGARASAALLLVAHLAVRLLAPYADPIMLPDGRAR